MTTPLNMSHSAMTAATEYGFEILPHPPYSPDMAPSVVYLFPKLKSHLHSMETRPNSALDLRRRCTSSVCEQSLCKV